MRERVLSECGEGEEEDDSSILAPVEAEVEVVISRRIHEAAEEVQCLFDEEVVGLLCLLSNLLKIDLQVH